MTEREHDPVESARPTIGGRDTPDALRPDLDRDSDRKLPEDEPSPDRPVPKGEPDADLQHPIAPDPE
jgi:hypothetical protein